MAAESLPLHEADKPTDLVHIFNFDFVDPGVVSHLESDGSYALHEVALADLGMRLTVNPEEPDEPDATQFRFELYDPGGTEDRNVAYAQAGLRMLLWLRANGMDRSKPVGGTMQTRLFSGIDPGVIVDATDFADALWARGDQLLMDDE